MTGAWKAGDVPAVERLVLNDVKSDPDMYQRLLVERNRTWLPKLEAFFGRRGHTFVVVGAGSDGRAATGWLRSGTDFQGATKLSS